MAVRNVFPVLVVLALLVGVCTPVSAAVPDGYVGLELIVDLLAPSDGPNTLLVSHGDFYAIGLEVASNNGTIDPFWAGMEGYPNEPFDLMGTPNSGLIAFGGPNPMRFPEDPWPPGPPLTTEWGQGFRYDGPNPPDMSDLVGQQAVSYELTDPKDHLQQVPLQITFIPEIPEPTTLVLLATGVLGLLVCGLRRRRAA